MVNLKPFCGIILLLSLASCRCDDPVVIDLGPVPDSILAKVPYEAGMNYPYRHSGGKLISFNANRESRIEQTWCEWRCCDNVYKYQIVTTTLKPDYPIFDLTLTLSSNNNDHPNIDVYIGRSHFYIPLLRGDYNWVGTADSLLVGDRWYRDVYRINQTDGGFPAGPIYADTLYYNLTEGIIRVIMSNGEYYEID